MNKYFSKQSAQKGVSLWDDDTTLADEGSIFVATNPTIGTGISQTICVDDAATGSSTHAQFAPALLLYNGDSLTNDNAVSLYLRYIRLKLNTAPASATAWYYSLRLDNLNRYSSGGSAITPVNPNPGNSKGTVSKLYFGAIVPSALPSSNALLVGGGAWDSAIPVVGDQYTLHFGGPMISNDMLSGGTTAKNVTMAAPPVVIPPGWSLSLDMWGPSNAVTAAAWEFEMVWAEREPGL